MVFRLVVNQYHLVPRTTDPYSRADSLDLARAEIRGAFENLDQSLIMAYELGNEVNLYDSYRPDDYDVEDYAADMREWIPELASQAPGSEPKFQFPSFAGPELFKEDMTIANLVEMGVPQSIPEIEYFAVHGYPWNICNGRSHWRPPKLVSLSLTPFLGFLE